MVNRDLFTEPFTEGVTRLEVIDSEGRSYTNYLVRNITFSLQDDGKTLKLFVEDAL